jgi:hypothetical protein
MSGTDLGTSIAAVRQARGTPSDWGALFTDECSSLLDDGVDREAACKRLAPILSDAFAYGINWTEAAEEGRRFLKRHYPEPGRVFRSPVAALRAVPESAGRFSTGITVLDRLSRGGGRIGDVWVFVGGPGSAKSTTMQQIAMKFAVAHSSPVVAFHADEGDGPASIRLGQMFGLDRELLEGKDLDTVVAFEERLAGLGYNMVDPDELTLEEGIEALVAMRANYPGPPVLLVDTIHTVLCTAADEATNAKERAEAIVGVYWSAAKRGILVLAAAEAVKGFYASKDPSKQTSGMAAAAESRAIAHRASIVVSMRPTPDDGTFEAFVEKNRVGTSRPRFHLRMDPTTTILMEIEERVVIDQAAARKARALTEESIVLQGRIETAIDSEKNYREGYPGLSENQLAKLCRVDKRKPAFHNALGGLVEAQKVLEAVPGPRDGIYYRRPVARDLMATK